MKWNSKRMNERMGKEIVGESMRGWKKERVREYVRGWRNERIREWIRGRGNEWKDEGRK